MNRPIGPLRVAVADDERDTREFFQEVLPRLGHQVVVAAETGRQLVDQCREVNPDLVITDIRMPDMDGIEAAEQVNRARQAPVVLVSAHHDAELIVRAGADHIMAYLIKPVKQADLETAIYLAVLRFEHFQKLSKEAADLRQALEDRKVIERAKGILMKRGRMDEPEAFRRLQKLASDRNKKLIEIAQMILTAEEALQPPPGPRPGPGGHPSGAGCSNFQTDDRAPATPSGAVALPCSPPPLPARRSLVPPRVRRATGPVRKPSPLAYPLPG